jgi:ribosome biogenesis protein Tsr3
MPLLRKKKFLLYGNEKNIETIMRINNATITDCKWDLFQKIKLNNPIKNKKKRKLPYVYATKHKYKVPQKFC